jgi:transposase
VENGVGDSSSLAVKRRPRRAKTDRRAGHKRLTRRLRHVAGEQRGWGIVRVPSGAEEDRRQLHRALATANRERARVIHRSTGVLASPGLVLPHSGDFRLQLEALRLGDGSPLPAGLRHRLGQEWAQVQVVAPRMGPWAADRRAWMPTAEEAARQNGRHLLTLKGMGTTRAWVFVMAFFGWRVFQNGTEVGALSGLPPTPDARGHTAAERGLANAGHAHSRALALAMAWGW